MLAGKSSGDEEKCLEDQLHDAKVAVGKAETELKQLETKISHSEKELKEKTSQLFSKSEEAAAFESELSIRTNDVDKVQKALEALPYKEGEIEALQKVSSFIVKESDNNLLHQNGTFHLFHFFWSENLVRIVQ